jgi:hypothetical protein
MTGRAQGLAVAAAAAVLVVSCGKGAPPPPSRDQVTALLRLEAESLQKEGEKVDPALGVAATWKIEAVEVSERPADASKPWNGTIRFGIESRTHDPDGSKTSDRFEKTFQYAFDAASGRWQMR